MNDKNEFYRLKKIHYISKNLISEFKNNQNIYYTDEDFGEIEKKVFNSYIDIIKKEDFIKMYREYLVAKLEKDKYTILISGLYRYYDILIEMIKDNKEIYDMHYFKKEE